jgi:hypothetical protein
MPAKKLTKQEKLVSALYRFWSRVQEGPGCWEWMGSKKPAGYGQLNLAGKMVNTHKFSWEIHNGPVEAGLVVRHKCDNPGCVNPDHLELGTPADNVGDAVVRGRMQHGDGHYMRKLEGKDIPEIRAAHAAGRGFVDLARDYGVSDSTIADAVYRRTWKHIT